MVCENNIIKTPIIIYKNHVLSHHYELVDLLDIEYRM